MGFHQGLSEIVRGGVLLVYYYSEKGAGYLRKNSFHETFEGHDYDWMIYINVNQSSDEQVRTFIHECIHASPKFLARLKELDRESLEKEIENLTEQTFGTEPNLVERIRNSVTTRESTAERFKKQMELPLYKGPHRSYMLYRIVPKKVR